MNYLTRSSAADDRTLADYEAYFGNDSGEDEDAKVLAASFIELHSFQKACDTARKLEIVKARKGMGKSALLSHLKYRLVDDANPIDESAVVVQVTGNNLMGLSDFSGKDASLLENRWKQVICKRISMELASQLGFAGSDDSMSLVEAAEIEGFKGKNLVTSLMNRIGSIVENTSKGLTNGALTIKVSNPTDSTNLAYEQILKRIQNSKPRNVWLLVDDIDAKFIDTPEIQARVGAFFSALRALAFSVEGLRIRASVRTDVWTNLRAMEDQDKLRQYVTDIKWSDDHLKTIFVKRILSHLQRDNDPNFRNWDEVSDYQRILGQVFTGEFRMGSERKGDPLSVAIALAGKRPRWMGQLCKLAGGAAGTQLIQQRHFAASMDAFGREKISDLIKEHTHQFTELQKVIDAFRGCEKTTTRFKLLSLIEKGFVNKFGVDQIPLVNGFPFKRVDQIAELLFEIDFIVGEKNGKHILFHEDPTLFDSEENQQNKISWVINLSYRSFLNVR